MKSEQCTPKDVMFDSPIYEYSVTLSHIATIDILSCQPPSGHPSFGGGGEKCRRGWNSLNGCSRSKKMRGTRGATRGRDF